MLPLFYFLLSFLVRFAVSRLPFDHASKSSTISNIDIIRRDIAIIGGGSSGTHAAISLIDHGYSTIVIEQKGRIGGHTETFVDPRSGRPIDYGVAVFHNEDLVRNYFGRFNISLTQDIPILNTAGYNLKFGSAINTSLYTPEETALAIKRYATIISRWPELNDGMFLPQPVDEDLTMPFGEFTKKHGIEAMIPVVGRLNTGLGDLLSIPMVENLRVMGLSLIESLSKGFLTTANHANSDIYIKAQTELLARRSLLLNTQIVFTDRGEEGVNLMVDTSEGKKLIVAKKLLITIPPKLDQLHGFDLDRHERNLFSRFMNAGYYTSIVRNTGVPKNLSIYNEDEQELFCLPTSPGIYSILQTEVPDLQRVFYGAPRTIRSTPLSRKSVRNAIMGGIRRLQLANPILFQNTEPLLEAYSSHTPFYLQVDSMDIQTGFYCRLYRLRGLRSTYWTGAAWRAHDSSSLWRYNEQIVLPQVIESLNLSRHMV